MQSECHEIVLASSSPRRAALLRRAGVPFRVVVAPVDEEPRPRETPAEVAARLAEEKAGAVAHKLGTLSAGASPGRGIVLGADTVVALGRHILGKPRDDAEAMTMLRALGGRSHRVTTGVAVLDADRGRRHVETVTTRVWMRPYTEEEIAAYVATGEPMDKAGAYAIQSTVARLVRRIDGCYTNVVGLPLCAVARALTAVGCPLQVAPRLGEVPSAADRDELEMIRLCPECGRLPHLQ